MKMRSFGKLQDGRTAGLYILRNENGMEASLSDFGATLVSLVVPGKEGRLYDVVLGYGDASGYEKGKHQIGGIVNRFSKRTEIDCYEKRLWEVKVPFTNVSSGDVIAQSGAKESMNDGGRLYVQDDVNGDSVTFVHSRPDENLHLTVTYILTNDNKLHIRYKAKGSDVSLINLSSHSYFNLAGHESGSVLDQLCSVNADSFAPFSDAKLPTGEIRDLSGTALDLRAATPLGDGIKSGDPQITAYGGYDHSYVLNGEGYRGVAYLGSLESGIEMRVYTDLSGMQLYTSNLIGLEPEEPAKDYAVYERHAAVCFETQFFPDTVSKKELTAEGFKKGEFIEACTTFAFDF